MPNLSPRERDVLYLISKEYSNFGIAKLLYLSKNTIDTHRRNLFVKFRVRNSAGLMSRSYELGILPMKIPESLMALETT